MTTATEETSAPELHWLAADKDYSIAISESKLVCRNPKGKQLASVPKWLKDTEQAQQLKSLADWLKEHEQESRNTAELWMLRSLPIPRAALAAVWPDPAWSQAMSNLVACPFDKKNNPDQDAAGFLRGVDAKKGIGIVDLDGDTQWLKANQVLIPHPILLQELDDFRELATELGFQQSIDQLFRETWSIEDGKEEERNISEFSSGKFEALTHVMGLCRRLGYRVRGGNAICPVWENERLTEARFWVGDGDPEYETWTGDLYFTDDRERSVPLGEVGPVTYSEGMRMASAIYAKRVVKTDEDDQ